MVPWRQSASLILLAKQATSTTGNKSLFDYATLLLKRSPQMRFAPHVSTWVLYSLIDKSDGTNDVSFCNQPTFDWKNYAWSILRNFPGGSLDPCDLSPEWTDYLSSSSSIDRFSKKTADIYKDIDHPYPGLVLRLCAIRETFEETGFLLVKPRVSSPADNSLFSTVTTMSNKLANEWREKVRRDASEFFVMCKEMHIEPDVHVLFEWSQFLAPAIFKTRFDNIFYVAAMPETRPCTIAADDKETVTAEWLEPDTAMLAYRQNLLDFLPPQIYELSRLANFRNLSNLLEFVSKREQDPTHRIERMLGVFYKMSEAQVIVFSGDDRYPSDGSYSTPLLQFNGKFDDFGGTIHNRLVMLKDANKKWQLLNNEHTDETNRHRLKPLSDGWEFSNRNR